MTPTVPGLTSLPGSWNQTTRVVKFEFLNYVRSRRFFVLVAINLVISGALTGLIGYYRPGSLVGSGLAFYSTWWGTSIVFLIALAGVFFGGDAISGEFQSKTGYFLVVRPVARSAIYLGKLIAAFLASVIILVLFAGIAVGNGWFYTGPPPVQFDESVGLALVYLLAVLGITFFFSSMFKSSSMSILVTLILFLFGFTLIQAIVTGFAKVEPWFMVTYASAIISNVLSVPYPTHLSPDRGFGSQYVASVPEGLVIMVVYALIGAVAGYFLFRRQDFT